MATDAKGVEVRIDSEVEGLIGHYNDKKARGRVFSVSPWGWVAFIDEHGRQWISYAGRFLVRDAPRPDSKRADVPDHLRR